MTPAQQPSRDVVAIARAAALDEARRTLEASLGGLWVWRGTGYVEPLHHRRHVRGPKRYPAVREGCER